MVGDHSQLDRLFRAHRRDPVRARLSLSTLLSGPLVAFIIEFDNEFERQMPHRTTNHGSTPGPGHTPWLVSMVMWSNCMQFVSDDGIPVRELARQARISDKSMGMLVARMGEWWGYLVVGPRPGDRRAKPPRSDWLVRPTGAGQRAQAVWRPLSGEIEERWRERFGAEDLDRLRASLQAVVEQFDVELPELFPVGAPRLEPRPSAAGEGASSKLSLPALLSEALLAFTLDFERNSDLGLALVANLLRVLDEKAVAVRDLPLLTGVSKEAISVLVARAAKKGVAVTEPVAAPGRGNLVRLTPAGRAARDASRQLLDVIEQRWRETFGEAAVDNLRGSLERLVGPTVALPSPLSPALEPYPDGWRAALRPPATLPHHPMVSHRGGFPDGS